MRLFVLRLFTVLGIASLAGSGLWYYYLFQTSPNQSIPQSGHLVPMMEHGHRFFIRRWESDLRGALMWGGLIVTVTMFVLDQRDRKRRGVAPDINPLLPPRPSGFPATPQDVVTREIAIFGAAALVTFFAAVGSGGAFPFGWLPDRF